MGMERAPAPMGRGCLVIAVISWCGLWLLLTLMSPVVFGSCFERMMRDGFVEPTALCSHTAVSWSLVAGQGLVVAGFAAAQSSPPARLGRWTTGRLSALAAAGAVGLFFLAGLEVRLAEPRPWAERSERSAPAAAVATTTTTRLDLAGQDLTGRDLSSVEFTGARLEGVVLTGADLAGRVFVRADLDDADLRGADLTSASFRFASLRRADLSGATARSAVFVDADLRDAVLAGADLADAELRRAVLRGADMTGAQLAGANLGNADLTGADLAGAAYDERTGWPAGYEPP